MRPDQRLTEDFMSKRKQDADVAFVQALAKVLREHDLSEIEVQREDGSDETLNVRLARQANVASPPVTTVPAATPAPVAALATTPATPAPPPPDDPAQHPGAVTSPMVGTVYLQSEPGTPPFVTVGDNVNEGDILCIVEAMKTMNQIHAPRTGTVRRILIEDASPVEFGAPLMIID